MARVIWIVRNRELHSLDLAVEGVVPGAVVGRHRSPRVLANIAPVASLEDNRQRGADLSFADLFAVQVQRCLASLAESAASIGELHPVLMFSGRERIGRLDEKALEAPPVIAVLELAVLGVQAPATDVR